MRWPICLPSLSPSLFLFLQHFNICVSEYFQFKINDWHQSVFGQLTIGCLNESRMALTSLIKCHRMRMPFWPIRHLQRHIYGRSTKIHFRAQNKRKVKKWVKWNTQWMNEAINGRLKSIAASKRQWPDRVTIEFRLELRCTQRRTTHVINQRPKCLWSHRRKV